MKTKSKSNENKGHWLNIVLAVVISAFVTFMITSTYFKSELKKEKQSEESQDEHITSGLEDDFDPESEKLHKQYATFKKHETNLGVYGDTYEDVGLKMMDSSHEIEDGYTSVNVKSEVTFRNISEVPIYIDYFEVSYQWDDEPSVSFQAVASHDAQADIEIDVEGTDSIVYPDEEITLTYDADIENNIAGEYGLSLYKFSHDYNYNVEYFIHTDDLDALED